uniref:Uncharacterized protein n=1 Tax=viral metagenome TaxID=1070528 RepID=A0A6C0CQL2_9ZZZZ
MTTLSEKVTSVLKHPVTGIVSGLYLTGVGLTAIKYLNKNKDKEEGAVNKVIAVGCITGLVGTATLFLGGRVAYKALKSD